MGGEEKQGTGGEMSTWADYSAAKEGQGQRDVWGKTISDAAGAFGGSGGSSPIPGLPETSANQGNIDVMSILDVLRRMGLSSQGTGTGGLDLTGIIKGG